MIDIRGGVPSKEADIRLGDMVVGTTLVRRRTSFEGTSVSGHLAKLGCLLKFQRGEAGADVLFESSYHHVQGQHATCAAQVDKKLGVYVMA